MARPAGFEPATYGFEVPNGFARFLFRGEILLPPAGTAIRLGVRQVQRARHRAHARARLAMALPAPLQRVPHRTPILCGRFHHHCLDLLRHQPRGQLPQRARARSHAPSVELALPFHRDVSDHDRQHLLVDVNSRNPVRHRVSSLRKAGAERVPDTTLLRVSGSRRVHRGRDHAHLFAQLAHAGSAN